MERCITNTKKPDGWKTIIYLMTHVLESPKRALDRT